MKRLVVGILAHVDAGKTTLSEALLYQSGQLRALGRVDHRDAFLDTEALERERGITIFSKQARLTVGELEVQLLDTPGHVDFSAEMERTLGVLDYALLVISGTDGVQSHTRTVWRLLRRYGVPTFLFVNKMDLAGADGGAVLAQLRRELDEGCVAFHPAPADWGEQVALRDEEALERYLADGAVPRETVRALIAGRRLFPVWFGSALKVQGVTELLEGLADYTRLPDYPAAFGARVFKIARDAQGARLTYLKVTGGTLRVKDLLSGGRGEGRWQEKADQLRLYSGAKFTPAEEAPAGTVCAVTGLSHTRPGEGLGAEQERPPALLEPVLTYQLLLPEGTDPYPALRQLRQLEEEDPQLHIVWNEPLRQIHVQLMGQVQLEILSRVIADRFGLAVSFGAGSVVHRETITAPAIGIGHFEPLRHYAEVHLLLEPGEPGSGLVLDSACPEDQLDRNWQRLILTHLAEREHPGVLTGAPITDMKITLLAGRAHVKHTEGGDFRQATYRAVRQGLMQLRAQGACVLLEPWYDLRLELPAECVGRAISDIQHFGGETEPPELSGETAVVTGAAPVAALGGYGAEVAAYTKGRGRLACAPRGYAPCREQAQAVEAAGYDPLRDAENPAESVFCAHGGGYTVPWEQVPACAHVSSGFSLEGAAREEPASPVQASARTAPAAGGFDQNKELQAIFERTYGPVKRRDFRPQQEVRRQEDGERRAIRPQRLGPEYLLVDGYNVIFAWDELKAVAQTNLDAARKLLCDLLSNYQGFRKNRVILVFDAYKVPRNTGEVTKYHNIHVVYTKESQTADAYIEKATYELGRENRVRVVTSDGAEQLIILGHGALRVPASAFREEVEQVEGQIASIVAKNNQTLHRGQALRTAMEKARREKPGGGRKQD